MREKAAVWFHAMYDEKYLYLLARFHRRQSAEQSGRDRRRPRIQWRLLAGPLDCRRRNSGRNAAATSPPGSGRDNRDVVLIQKGKTFKDGETKDAKQLGVLQAFQTNADGSGYVQELAVPWALLTKDGQPLHAGDKMQLTIEPNFTLRGSARLTIKDLFKPNMPLDRIFTFTAWRQWGWATLEKQGHCRRGRSAFPTAASLPCGSKTICRSSIGPGLIKGREFKGFKNIDVDVPADGIVSLNILEQTRTRRSATAQRRVSHQRET